MPDPKLPQPTKGSSATADICLGVAADIASVASAGGIPTNAVLELIKALKNKRIEAAQRVLMDLIREGRADLDDAEHEQLVPIAYHFFRAAEAGERIRTLRIYARVLAGQIEGRCVDCSDFAFLTSAVSGL